MLQLQPNLSLLVVMELLRQFVHT